MATTSLCEHGGSSKFVLQNKEYARKNLWTLAGHYGIVLCQERGLTNGTKETAHEWKSITITMK